MEENTIKMTPEVKVENKKENAVKEQPKPTYDELDNAVKRMYQENQYLRGEIEKAYKFINQLQVENGFKRLDCLFKSLEYAHYFDNEYIDDVIKEIKEMIVLKDNVEGSADAEKKEEPTDETANQ